MPSTDVAIVGAGLAGSTAAAMLGRKGIQTTVIDPHVASPADFRCAKLDPSQIAALRRTGLADPVLATGTVGHQVSVARGGRLVDSKPHAQCNILYDALVNTVRGEISPNVTRIIGKVTAASNTADRQVLTLSTGETLTARLMIVATGLNLGLRHILGVQREVISPNHSISIGFDLAPGDGEQFAFPALTYFPERLSARMAYLTLFPVGPVMRANLFVYREMTDPWLEGFRRAPEASLLELMPNLRRLAGDFRVSSFVKIRPVDLVITKGYRQPGFVLVGDAFATSCPAAGTGSNKVFTDVERLCNVYIPQWLQTPGMGREKVEAFYNDPEKVATDAFSEKKAFRLRALSREGGLIWRARRSIRFVGHLALGSVRRALESWRPSVPHLPASPTK